jgi:poly(A) polymerase/tRNA nucleotidyltransferase (CCA-adding enzyme)
MIVRKDIPHEVQHVADTLEAAGFDAYLVGGCVRDLMLKRTPKDWDITTNAVPEEIQKLFPDSYCNNDYGTVGVVTEGAGDERLKVIEVTPYRKESGYSDKRRPDVVEFGVSLEEDLARRDFTINAIAYRLADETTVDLFDGAADMHKKRLKTVGNPGDRFGEDALRMLRAVRLAAELNFAIEADTMAAIGAHHGLLAHISAERIREEFFRILLSETPMQGIAILERLGLIAYILPEIKEAIGCEQNQAHAFDVYEHLLRTLQAAADKGFSLELRIAALLHDIGKPASRQWSDAKKDWTFHGHEVIGARMTRAILKRWKVSREMSELIEKLVRWHMFFSDPDEVTLSAVRRTITRVGETHIDDLLNLRVCDRIGTGRPKEQPFRFRKYKAMVDQALRDPVSVRMLGIKGDEIMDITGERPGKRLGFMLHALLEEVLDDPARNAHEYLEKRVVELQNTSDEELEELANRGKARQAAEEAAALKEIDRKHKVG